jgi:hypothetical protein
MIKASCDIVVSELRAREQDSALSKLQLRTKWIFVNCVWLKDDAATLKQVIERQIS